MTTYLLDKSAWIQTQHGGIATRRIADLVRRGDLALCTVTAMEILFSARNADEYDRDYQRLATMRWFDLAAPRRAVELQHDLAKRGWHRTSIPDVVIAATAAEHGLVVLHYDSGYERLAEVSGTEHEWIVPRGTGRGKMPDRAPTEPARGGGAAE